MSEQATVAPLIAPPFAPAVPTPSPTSREAKSFVAHAKLISFFTLISRVLGMARESVSAWCFGAGVVSSAFNFAFSIPNLFRKLFGEGALSAAFIPLYTKELREQSAPDANDFAAASVNLLCVMLLAITAVGEAVLAGIILLTPDLRPDWLLALKFTAIMLPYVLLICGTAFLSSILQVHKRFGPPAFAPVLLNVVHIAVIVAGAWLLGLNKTTRQPQATALQTTLAYWLCFFVLVAGVLQVMILWPSLKAVGFRPRWASRFWSPAVKRMLWLSVPVALGAGVLQLSVLMDKSIAMLLSAPDAAATHFHLFGHSFRYPMEVGATARLNWAQTLYQFPLGVFAIALATALFPALSADALDQDRDKFRSALRTGIEATLFEGLAASVGLIVVRLPATQLLFQHGHVTPHDSELIARSLMWYATAIWAFSLLQIVNRGFYALHDTKTPLVMSVVNIVINLAVELPLVWVKGLGESGMAVGTCVSFAVQTVIMLWILDRRIGGLGLKRIAPAVGKMALAAGVMAAACWGVQRLAWFPAGEGAGRWLAQLLILVTVGAGVYVGLCRLMGLGVLEHLLPKRKLRQAKI